MRTLRVVAIGLVHDHCWGEMAKVAKVPGCKLVAAAARPQPLRRMVQQRHPGVRTYENWRTMVRQEQPDIALLMLENATTHPVVAELAKRGVHMLSEKPMAARLAHADVMLKAARRHKVKLLINWPTAWNPALHLARRLVQAGRIGRVYLAKARGGHFGPKEIGCSPYFWKWLYSARLNGAGSLADYGGYGANMFRFVLNEQPVSVAAIARRLTKKYYVPDDNAVLSLEYRRALGIIETTWSQVAAPPFPSPVFYGTRGTLGIWGHEVHIWRRGRKTEVLKPRGLPQGRRTGPEYLAWAVRNRGTITGPCDPQISRDAQEVIEAAILSSASGCRIRLPL